MLPPRWPHRRPQTGTASRGPVLATITSSNMCTLALSACYSPGTEKGVTVGGHPRRPREPLCGPRIPAARSPLIFLSQAGRAGGRLAGPAPRAFALPSREDPGPAGGQWGAGKGRGQSWPGLGGPHAPHSPARPPCRVPCQAYAVMLALSEDAPSQSPLDAWLNVTGAAPESGAFDPVNHL